MKSARQHRKPKPAAPLELCQSKDPFARRAVAATLATVLCVGAGVERFVASQDNTIKNLQQSNATLMAENNRQLGQLARQGRIIAGMNQVDPADILSGRLQQPDQLPGYGQQVSSEDKFLLEDSAVKIVKRPRGTQQPWAEVCSGNKMNIGGNIYVSTAAHCDSDAWTKTPRAITDPAVRASAALDVLPYSSFDFAIAEPDSAAFGGDDQSLLAVVTGEAMDPDVSDQALLSISTKTNAVVWQGTTPVFDMLSALDASKLAYTPPPLGASVESYGYPQNNNDSPVEGGGEFVGRAVMRGNYNANYAMDVYGIRNVDSETDSCDYGESGSTITYSDGQTSGALSMRLGNAYSSYGGSQQNLENGDGVLYLEQQLGGQVDLTNFSVLCFAVAPDKAVFDSLAKVLSQ